MTDQPEDHTDTEKAVIKFMHDLLLAARKTRETHIRSALPEDSKVRKDAERCFSMAIEHMFRFTKLY